MLCFSRCVECIVVDPFLFYFVCSLCMFSYIDEETTALFVLIQVYNPTYNVFARLETATVFPLSGSVYNDFNVKGGYLVMNVDKQHKPAQQLSTSFVLVIFMVMESLLWIYEMYEGKKKKRTKILDCCCAPVGTRVVLIFLSLWLLGCLMVWQNRIYIVEQIRGIGCHCAFFVHLVHLANRSRQHI